MQKINAVVVNSRYLSDKEISFMLQAVKRKVKN